MRSLVLSYRNAELRTSEDSADSSFLARFEKNRCRGKMQFITLRLSPSDRYSISTPSVIGGKNPQFAAQRSDKKQAKESKLDRKAGRSAAAAASRFFLPALHRPHSRLGADPRSASCGKLSNHDVSPFQTQTSRTRSLCGSSQPQFSDFGKARCHPSCS